MKIVIIIITIIAVIGGLIYLTVRFAKNKINKTNQVGGGSGGVKRVIKNTY